ncbi:MAG: hypothetical protein H7Z73_12635 [Candidatus Saccharibacteria bacterium]|nr:hypothetical protein [Moraxellaceae bacterium]
MSSIKKQPLVGFERFVAFDWLDQTAKWVIEGKSPKEVHDLIDDYLASQISGDTSKRKTKNVLSGVWVKSDGVDPEYKEQAKNLYLMANRTEKIAINYGLFIASYPFFYSLGRILGRLFKLQDDVTNAEFYRRCVEANGDRESIKRAAARYLQSVVEWGLLDDAESAKVKPTKKIVIDNPSIVTWLMTSVLFSSDRERLSVDELLSDPIWFPFEISTRDFQIGESQLLEVVHQNVGSVLLALKVPERRLK